LNKHIRIKLGIGFIIALLLFSSISTFAHVGNTRGEVKNEQTIEFPIDYHLYDEWIIKWKEGYDQPESEDFQILNTDIERRIQLIKLHPEQDITEWFKGWVQKEEIEYLEPSYPLKISAQPNDFYYDKQAYLQQINAQEGWEFQKANKQVTIAVLDTGVDLNHPDLRGNLVPGINLIDPLKEPLDDHGHGTQVSGVLGAVGNNNRGIAGVLWSTNIMPVKVLPKEGEGSPFTTSQGIYQSIDKGATIVLLSLGGPVFSKTLQEAVEYAEDHGVLVIAATGNEGARVNYPAAFPSVLAVGAVDSEDKPSKYSNSGPEVSVVAPGNVYTTRLGGGYGKHSGTSMSAPQVAGLAALILKKYPKLKPSEVRNLIIYTSKDVHQKGWDVQTGHGRIDIAKALNTQPVANIYGANNTISNAGVFPIETMLRSELRSASDVAWYKFDAPYRGKIKLNVNLDSAKTAGVDLTYFPDGQQEQSFLYNIKKESELELTVPKGVSYIRLQYNSNESRTTPLKYTMKNTFEIYSDAQQPNDFRTQATKLAGDGTLITATLHRDNLSDWYYFDSPGKGQIDVDITVDTMRLDPVLTFETPNGGPVRIDEGNYHNGQEERLIENVEKGRYYFRIHNYYGNKVNGEYYLRLTYTQLFVDGNESNNTRELATRVQLQEQVKGNVSPISDVDWYRFSVSQEGYVGIELKDFPQEVGLNVALYTQNQRLISSKKQTGEQGNLFISDKIMPGTYYIMITADKEFPFDSYTLQVIHQELIGGYRDIKGHWASAEILKASEAGIVQGLGNFQFGPNETMTRASVALILQRLYSYSKPATPFNYTDLSKTHWAYDAIQGVSEARIMRGYNNGTFGVSESITRAEVAVVFDRILLPKSSINSNGNYTDVKKDFWAYESIKRLTQAGLLKGDQNGTFRPNAAMTRAEFVTLVNRIIE
jgi:serine protease